LLLLLSFASVGQDKCFQAYNLDGQELEVLCVGQEVTFQDCGNEVPDENEYYVFNYRSGSPIPADASNAQTHNYTAAGRYRVLQIANYGNSTLTDTVSQVFEVRDAPPPAFITQSCASGAVSVTLTDINYDSFSIDFGDNQQFSDAQPNTTIQHEYITPGSYTITVTGSYTGGSCSGEGSAIIETLPAATQPFLRSLTVLEQAPNGAIEIELADLQPGYNYIVQQWQINDPRLNYLTVDTIRNITQPTLTHQVQNINTTEGNWYLVRPLDECGTTFLNSNIVSSIALQATSSNDQVTLLWESMPHAETFEVYRNGSLLQTLSSATKAYIDTDVACGQPYLYEVRGLASNGSTSVSAIQEVQVTSAAAPPAPYLLSSFDLNNHVVLSVELPQGEILQQANLERSVAGAAFQPLAQPQQPQYIDEKATPEAICYRATFTNACGNTSPLSNVSCPVILKAQKQDGGAAVFLEWTSYQGFPVAVRQYNVELLDDSGNVVSSYSVTGNTFTDRTLSDELKQLRYRISATAQTGAAITFSNVVVVEQELLLYIPSGFTPNGDGLNDIFEIKGRFFTGYDIRIYNNMGNVLYQATEADAPWDGTYKGQHLPAGAYAYEITANTKFGNAVRRTGTVTLLR
jgi:gliding motility-associated-like protein